MPYRPKKKSVSEEYLALIIRVGEYPKQESSEKQSIAFLCVGSW
jgi:hypothetical protein